MKIIQSILVLIASVSTVFAQESYDNCATPQPLCVNTPVTVNNINATSCTSCADAAASCFVTQNSIWLSFTTNANGGDVNLAFSNLNFQNGIAFQAVIFESSNGCDPNGLTEVSTCETNITGNFSINAFGLTPNTEYLVLVNGNGGAEGSVDLVLNGTAVQTQPAQFLISYEGGAICYGEEVTVNASLTGCDTNEIQWFVNGSLVETNTDLSFTTSSLQDGDEVSAIVTCFAPCDESYTSNALTFMVNGYVVYAGYDRSITLGEDTKLNASTDATTFTWFPTIGMKYPDLLQPFVAPKTTTTYTLTVTDGTCTSSDEVVVTVESPLDIKNTFTPMGMETMIPGKYRALNNFQIVR